MKKLSLKSIYKKLLKEEIDFSSKKAIVYHLTGVRNRDRLNAFNWIDIDNDNPTRSNDSNNRAREILDNIEQRAIQSRNEEIASEEDGRKNDAYEIASNVLGGNMYSLGSSFMAGGGDMYGRGLYTCYKFNPRIARIYGSVILRFEVDLTNFMIFNAGIAKQIHGENWKLEDQFLSILERKGFINRNDPDVLNIFEIYLNHLSTSSNMAEFLNSTYDNELRTAPIALNAIVNMSTLSSGTLKFREMIEGVIFYGSNDGPVCVIYQPEINNSYALTGAGYFNNEGDPVIKDSLEELVGRSQSISLKDSIDIAKETDAEDLDKRSEEFYEEQRQKLSNAIKTGEFKTDPITEQVREAYRQLQSTFSNTLRSTNILGLDELNVNLAPLYLEIADKRVNNDASNKRYFDSVARAIYTILSAPSKLCQPVIDFINEFGPGISITSYNEFSGYVQLIKNINDNKSIEEIKLEYPSIKLLKPVTKKDVKPYITEINKNKTLTEDFKNILDSLLFTVTGTSSSDNASEKIKTSFYNFDYIYNLNFNVAEELLLIQNNNVFNEWCRNVSNNLLLLIDNNLDELEENIRNETIKFIDYVNDNFYTKLIDGKAISVQSLGIDEGGIADGASTFIAYSLDHASFGSLINLNQNEKINLASVLAYFYDFCYGDEYTVMEFLEDVSGEVFNFFNFEQIIKYSLSNEINFSSLNKILNDHAVKDKADCIENVVYYNMDSSLELRWISNSGTYEI